MGRVMSTGRCPPLSLTALAFGQQLLTVTTERRAKLSILRLNVALYSHSAATESRCPVAYT